MTDTVAERILTKIDVMRTNGVVDKVYVELASVGYDAADADMWAGAVVYMAEEVGAEIARSTDEDSTEVVTRTTKGPLWP